MPASTNQPTTPRSWSVGHARVSLALLIAILGGGFLIYRIGEPWGAGPAPSPAPPMPANAAALLSGTFDTTPTVATAVQDCAAIAHAASTKARAILAAGPSGGNSRLERLSPAILERLLATIAPDPDRDLAARRARGATLPELTPDAEKAYASERAFTALAPMDASGIEVRWIYQRGKRVAPWPVEEGFGAQSYSTRGATRMDIPESAEQARLDVVEVRVPMNIKPLDGGDRVRVLVGYQFAWSMLRKDWIPFVNILYSDPDAKLAAVPF